MALETATYIDGLDPLNPEFDDLVREADDHMRLIKDTLKNTFPLAAGAIPITGDGSSAIITGSLSVSEAFDLAKGMRLAEQADHFYTPGAGFAQLWLNASGELIFTDAAGSDENLSGHMQASPTPLVNEIGVFVDGNTIRGFAGFEWDGSSFTIPDQVITGAASILYGPADTLNWMIGRNSNTGGTLLTGSNAGNVGGNILLYGEAHASTAGDVRLRSGTVDFLQWDQSLTNLILTAAGDIELVALQVEVGSLTPASLNEIRNAIADGTLHLDGQGPSMYLYGSSHATRANDWEIRSGGFTMMNWDESAGTWDVRTGIGAKTVALTIDASQVADFASDVTIPSEARVYFDGGANTYIAEQSNNLNVFRGGSQALSFTSQGSTFFGKVQTPASITGRAGLNIAEGVAPTTPADGDVWVTAAGEFFARLNGVSVNLDDAGVFTGSIADNQVAVGSGVDALEGTANLTFDGSNFTITDREVRITSTIPTLRLTETDQALDQKVWEIQATNGDLQYQLTDDGGTNQYTYIDISRSGTGASVQVDTITFFAATNLAVQAPTFFTGNMDITGNITCDGATVQGNLLVSSGGTFTSRGIDDNATVERLAISDSGIVIGANTAASVYDFVRATSSGAMRIAGGNHSADGGQIWLYGSSHATLGGDAQFASSNQTFMYWDESVGSLAISTGIGTKTLAMTVEPDQEIAFANGIKVPDGILLTEQADHRFTPAATLGEMWLRNDANQTLMFTDDAGVDHEVAGTDVVGGGVSTSGTPVDNQLAIFEDASTIHGDSGLTYNHVSNVLTVLGGVTLGGNGVHLDESGDSGLTMRSANATISQLIFEDDVSTQFGRIYASSTGGDHIGFYDSGGNPTFICNNDDAFVWYTDNVTTRMTLANDGTLTLTGEIEMEAFSEDADQYTATTGTRDLDVSLATYFYPSADLGTAVITFTFSNPAASGRVSSFTLELLGADGATLTWPTSVDWPAATEPTWTAGVDIVSFVTRDGGTTWHGFLGTQNSS